MHLKTKRINTFRRTEAKTVLCCLEIRSFTRTGSKLRARLIFSFTLLSMGTSNYLTLNTTNFVDMFKIKFLLLTILVTMSWSWRLNAHRFQNLLHACTYNRTDHHKDVVIFAVHWGITWTIPFNTQTEGHAMIIFLLMKIAVPVNFTDSDTSVVQNGR